MTCIFIHLTIYAKGTLIKNKHFSETLLQHIEEYISEQFMEVLDTLAEVANVKELKQSVHVACVLRESILGSCNISYAETSGSSREYGVSSQQAQLAHQLQSALMALQVLIEHAPGLASSIGDQMLQRVAEVASLLCEDLAAVVSATQVAVLQADIANQTEKTIFKESVIIDTPTEQVEKLTVSDEAVTVQQYFEQSTPMESTDTIAQLPGKIMVDDNLEISAVETGVVVSDENFISIEQESLNESKSELVVDDNVDKVAGVTNTEVTSAIYAQCEVSANLADSDSVIKHEIEVNTTAIFDYEVEKSAPFTGNFVLIHCITLIPI